LRRLVAPILGVAACILLPLSLLSTWGAAVVTDTSRYVEKVAPLANEPVVKRAVTRRVEQFAVTAIDRNGPKRLPRLVRAAAVQAVHQAVPEVVDSPAFPPAWRVANRAAHRQVTAMLSGDSNGIVDSEGRVTISLAPVLEVVVARLDQQHAVPASAIPNLDTSVTSMTLTDLRRAQAVYDVLGPAGYWLPAAWLIVVAVMLMVASNRRRALGWLAVGSIIGVAALWFAMRAVRREALAGIANRDDATVARAIWDAVISPLDLAIVTALIIASVVLLLSWLMGRMAR
jgi:hypothetical protein